MNFFINWILSDLGNWKQQLENELSTIKKTQ